jgi:hypothetical protein
MYTKLTLSIKKTVTERAKKYARQKKTSLSKLVENHLDKLTEEEKPITITPLVKTLSGVVSAEAADKGKKEYAKFLRKKYS